MTRIKGFDHVGITVEDLDLVTAFFVGLGLEVEGRTFVEGEFLDTVCGIPDSRTEIVMLRPPDGGTGLELSSFVRPDHRPGSPAAMANELGLRNVCFEISDLQATLDGLAADGYGLVGDIGQYENIVRMAYVRGPEGIVVALSERINEFVPVGFDPPTSLVADRFRLEPLGPQHNRADHAAWMSSIEHIRSTPGYPDGRWPPLHGMTLEENLSDLHRHADDFARGAGFTFTVLEPGDDDVIGCVYLYPSASEDWDVTVQSWVRADRSDLDVPLADAVACWLATNWPWERVDRRGR